MKAVLVAVAALLLLPAAAGSQPTRGEARPATPQATASSSPRLTKREARKTAKKWAHKQCESMEHIALEPGGVSLGCWSYGLMPPGCTRVIGDKAMAMGCAVEWLLTPITMGNNPTMGYSCSAVAQVEKGRTGRVKVNTSSSAYHCEWVSFPGRA